MPQIRFQCGRSGAVEPAGIDVLLDGANFRCVGGGPVLLGRPVLHHHGDGCGSAAIARLRNERNIDPDAASRLPGYSHQEQEKGCPTKQVQHR